jgi:ATP-dependent helicase Lhr and Lhr-like helicase
LSARYGVAGSSMEPALRALHAQGKLLEGEFRPNGAHREWCDPEILQQIRRRSLANLRREIEPVEQRTFARLLTRWQGITVPRRGLDALLDTIESLQGASLLASDLERDILPVRVAGYQRSDLDMLMAAGEVAWVGVEQVGERDGRLALYLTGSLPLLLPPVDPVKETKPLSFRATAIVAFLQTSGASFFSAIHAACGGGFPGETQEALWELVWNGRITNDTFHPVRTMLYPAERRHERNAGPGAGSPEFLRRLRSRTSGGGAVAGRWSLIRANISQAVSVTEWSANVAQQLLARHGIVTRETALAENLPGGYNMIYPALRKMEESGWIRRGMFVTGLGAAQFAMPGAVDMLRSLRIDPEMPEGVALAATDPANPYGTVLPWTRMEAGADDAAAHQPSAGQTPAPALQAAAPHAMARVSGATVILVNGQLAGFLRRRNPAIRVFLPEAEPERSATADKLAKQLAELAVRRQQGRRSGLLIAKVNEVPAREHPIGRFLEDAGFVDTALGYQMRRLASIAPSINEPEELEEPEQNMPETAEGA